MIASALVIAAFCLTYLLTRRSLPMGIVSAFVVGYVHGLVRANVLHPLTSFMFDAALAGLYLAALSRSPALRGPAWQRPLGAWVAVLVLWPAMMALIPINHLAVQLVAFRASIWFLLMMMIGSSLDLAGLKQIARWLAVMNVAALAVGVYLYLYGVPSLYPENAVTALTYRSRDVADSQWRIPSTFLHAQSYGGTMLLSIPLMIALGFERAHARANDGLLAVVGAVAAAGGILLCGARVPFVLASMSAILALILSRANIKLLLATFGMIAVAAIVVSGNERLQRSMTLLDTDLVSKRVAGSLNSEFFELIARHPLGAGMGSAFGTSIPYFLAKYAPTPIGAENEFSRIQVNQGVVGLVLWIGFLVWFFSAIPRRTRQARVPVYLTCIYSMTLSIWVTAWIGSGATSAIPGSALMFMLMGVLRSTHLRGDSTAIRTPLSARPSHFVYDTTALDHRRG